MGTHRNQNPRFTRPFWRSGRAVLRAVAVGFVLLTQLASYTYIAALPASAANSVPLLLNYQARITDSSGVPVPDGNLNIWIRVYDAASSGTCLYSMRGSCGSPSFKNVTVTNGVFSMLIGDQAGGDVPLPEELFNANSLFLGVTVASDTEMVPRKRITTAPYAVNADRLDDLDTTDSGSTTPYVVRTTANGNLRITGDPQGPFIDSAAFYLNPATATGNEMLFAIADNGSTRFSMDREGDIAHTGSLSATAASSTAQFIFRGASSQSQNIFEVQDALTNRMLAVSATATTIGSTSSTDAVIFSSRVGSNFTPTTDATFDLGDYNRRWRDLWLSGGSANIAYDTSGTSVLRLGFESSQGLRGVIKTPDNIPLQLRSGNSATSGITIAAGGAVSIPNLTVTSCTGCGGNTSLNQAYLNSTSTTEIFITGSQGALTIADTFSGTGNVFEIQDRTNAAGDYSRRHLTVSATATLINPSGASGYMLGVGTSTPSTSALATFEGDTVEQLRLVETAAGLSSDIQFVNTVRTWSVFADSSPDQFGINHVGNSRLELSMTPEGYLGLGATDATPNAILEVHGDLETPTVALLRITNLEDNQPYYSFSATSTQWTNKGDVAIMLTADTDNVNEDDNPYILWSQDDATVTTIMGLTGSAGFDPQNVGYTDTNSNAFLIGGRNATSQFQVGTNGAVRLTVDSAGLVGIGTNAPDAMLDISSAAASGGIFVDNTAVTGDPIVAFQLSGTTQFTMGVDDSDADKFKISTTALGTNDRLVIDSAGLVGIGQAAPTSRLHVTPAANDEAIAVSGYSITGANANALLTMTGTWNTSGAPIGILLNITDTASSGNATLMTLQQSSVTRFNVSKTGTTSVTINNGSSSITSASVLNLINSDASANNFSSIFFGDGSGVGSIVANQFVSHGASAVGNLVVSTRDNAGSFGTRLTVGATTTAVTNDLTVGSSSSTDFLDLTNARVGSNLTPTTDATFDLGDYDRRWRDLWLSGGSLNVAYDAGGTTTFRTSWSDVEGRRVKMDTANQPWQVTPGGGFAGMYMDKFGRFAIGKASVVAPGALIGSGFLQIDAASGTQRSLAITIPSNATVNTLEIIDSGTVDVSVDRFGAFYALNTAGFKALPGDSNFAFQVGSGGRTNQFKPRNGNASAVSISPTSGMGSTENLLQFYDDSAENVWTRFNRFGQLIFGATTTDETALLTIATSTAATTILDIRDLNPFSSSYTQHYLTVSTTSTNIAYNADTTDSAMSVSATGLTTGTGLTITGPATSLTTGSLLRLTGVTSSAGNSTGALIDATMTGNPGSTNSAAAVRYTLNGITSGVGQVISANGLTSGTGLQISTSSNSMTSATLLRLQKTGTNSANTAYTGNVAEISYAQSITSGATDPNHSGSLLDLARSYTVSAANQDVDLTGPILRITDSGTVTTGHLFNGSNLLEINQTFVSATGTSLKVVSSATAGGGAFFAGKFEPLTVAGYMPSPTSNLFQVQNTSEADGVSYTSQYFTVSSTATRVFGDLVVSGACTGCGGGAATLQSAYANSSATGSEIYLDSTRGALTLADSFSSFGGNIFEIQDRTNAAGDYSTRYLTVSSTSTNFANDVFIAGGGNLTMSSGNGIFSQSWSGTNGNPFTVSLTALTTSPGVRILGTGTQLSSGSLLTVAKTGSGGSTDFSGKIADFSYAHTYSVANTRVNSGKVLQVSRAITNSGVSSVTYITGPVASFTDNVIHTAGTVNHGGPVVEIVQNYASATGTVLSVTSNSATSRGAYISGHTGLTVAGRTPSPTANLFEVQNFTTSLGDYSAKYLTVSSTSTIVGNASSTYALNLTGARVSSNLTPTTDATFDLGDHDRRWRDLWLSGGTLHLGASQGDEGTISYNTGTNQLVFDASGGVSMAGAVSFDSNVGIGTSSPGALLDVRGPAPTSTVGTLSIPDATGDLVNEVIVQGDYAYVHYNGTPNDIIAIIDVSDPTGPELVGNVPAHISTAGFDVQGDFLYAQEDPGTNRMFSVYDIGDKTSPLKTGETSTTGANFGRIDVAGRYAYSVSSNLNTIDISNPGAPVQVDFLFLGSSGDDVKVRGEHAYVLDASAFRIIDVSNPETADVAGTTSTSSTPQTFDLFGKYAYVTSFASDNINIIDVSDPKSPAVVAEYDLDVNAEPRKIVINGKRAYVAASGIDEIVILDLSDPLAPTEVGAIATSGGQNFDVKGRYLYFMEGSSFEVYDLNGAYIQQLEVGGLETGRATVAGRLDALSATVLNGLSVGGSTVIDGTLSIQSSTTSSVTSSLLSVGAYPQSTATFGGTLLELMAQAPTVNGFTGKGLYISASGTSATSGLIRVDDDAAGTLFTLNGNGWVGIGSASPSYALDVTGSVRATESISFSDGSTQPVAYTSAELGWNVQTASVDASIDISTDEAAPGQVFFRPDGKKMFVIGAGTDEVNQYTLTVAWDVSTASVGTPFSVTAEESIPSGMFFRQDGKKMYVIGTNGQEVNEYDLSTAWDPTTAAPVRVFSVSGQETSPRGVFFKPDGKKMYVTGTTGDDVNEYDLSTPWVVTSASFVQVFSVAGQTTFPEDIFFRADGRRMYIADGINDQVEEYELTTPWNVSTSVFLRNRAVSVEDTSTTGIFFKPDGTKMFTSTGLNDEINSYTVGLNADGGNSYIFNTSIGRSGGDYQTIGYNVGFTSSNDTYFYRQTDTAAAIKLGDGGGDIAFFTAGAGTSGNSLTLTERARIQDSAFSATVSGQDTERVCHTGANTTGGQYVTFVDCTGTPGDYAEEYGTTDASIEAADVVAVDLSREGEVVVDEEGVEGSKAWMVKTSEPYQANLLGVISTRANEIIGQNFEPGENPRPVVLSGRVPVKVNLEGGAIAIGDAITSSGTAGVGMRSNKPGMVIGRALSSFTGPGSGTVIVDIRVGFHSGLTITTDGAMSLFNDDFSFLPPAYADSLQTAIASRELSFIGSAWNAASSTSVTRAISLKTEIAGPASYQFAFRNDDGGLLAALNQAGDLSIAGSLTVNGGFDYAETFPAAPDLDAGDVVMIDPENSTGYGVKKSESAYENALIGVISTKPGFLTGKQEAGTQPVALAGRVPVKVNDEGGDIRPGDPVTSSSERGVAMRAVEAGRVIGIALQGSDKAKDGKILIFVNPSWWNGPTPAAGATAQGTLAVTQDSLLDFKNSVLSNVAAIISTNGSWSVTSDGQLAAQKIEAKEVVAGKFTVAAASDAPERLVGVGRIQAGYDATIVLNPAMRPDSLVVVTFETNPGANWWIDEKADGHFILKMAQGAHMDLKFTYWIIPVAGQLDPQPDDSASGTPETPPPPTDPPPTESGTGTGETGSGTGTEETS